MNEPQQTRVSFGHFHNIESQLAGVLVAAERPPVIIQTASEFVMSVAAGQSSMFSVVRTVNKPGGCIAYDPNRLHFFSDSCHMEGLDMSQVEPFIQKFSSIDEIKAFHRDLLSKPFAFKTRLEARRKSDKFLEGNVTYVTKADVVVTVFPQHPDVKAVFAEELAKAEEKVDDDEKCSFDISFDRILRKWFGDFMLRTTGQKWNSHGAYLGWKSSIITTNHSAPVEFCGHVGCRLFAIFLCPIWCCAFCWYTIYRGKTSKDQTIHFDFTAGTGAQCVV